MPGFSLSRSMVGKVDEKEREQYSQGNEEKYEESDEKREGEWARETERTPREVQSRRTGNLTLQPS